MGKPAKKEEAEVKMNRRAEDRRGADRRKQEVPVAVERRSKVQRRRQIDPTTCEREYNQEEIEFMHALDAYKRTSGRMFPTCSEILEVIRGMGYVKMPTNTGAPIDATPAVPASPVQAV